METLTEIRRSGGDNGIIYVAECKSCDWRTEIFGKGSKEYRDKLRLEHERDFEDHIVEIRKYF